MEELAKRTLQLQYIPECLANDFEEMLLTTYLSHGWHDLKNLTKSLIFFAGYRLSYLETGDPFAFEGEERLRRKQDETMELDFLEVTGDIQRVLEFHQMFYAEIDKANEAIPRDWEGCHNFWVTEVW